MNRKRKLDLIFCICLIIIPLIQFCIFYIGVNFNSFKLAFQKWDGMGGYEFMEQFAEAYNAADSALKAEIDTWSTDYWAVENGVISFKHNSTVTA